MIEIRYVTVSKLALELVGALTINEKAEFLDVLNKWTKKLMNGNELTPEDMPETDNQVLKLAFEKAKPELEFGYRSYMQKVNARKGKPSSADQQIINDQSTINRRTDSERSTNDQEEENRSRIEENGNDQIEENTDTFNSDRIEAGRQAEIVSRLSALGIQNPDAGFWNTCHRYGYKAVDAALDKAQSVGGGNLHWITKMIAQGTDYMY